MRFYVVLCLFLSFSTAVFAKNSDSTDSVTYFFNTNIDVSKVPADRQSLAEQINRHQPVSFKAITNLYIQDQQDDFNYQNMTPVRNAKAELKPMIEAAKGKPILKMKAAYEPKAFNQELMYNSDHWNIFLIPRFGRVQCSTGTTLNLIIARENMSATEYQDSGHVVIFEDGHVLPGVISNGRLIGIETTATGDGIVEYDKKDSSTWAEGERTVVDAEFFVLSEVFKSGLNDKAAEAIKNEMIVATATMYQATVKKQKANKNQTAQALATSKNSSIFAFGTPLSNTGDIARTAAAPRGYSGYYGSNERQCAWTGACKQTSFYGQCTGIMYHAYTGQIYPCYPTIGAPNNCSGHTMTPTDSNYLPIWAYTRICP